MFSFGCPNLPASSFYEWIYLVLRLSDAGSMTVQLSKGSVKMLMTSRSFDTLG